MSFISYFDYAQTMEILVYSASLSARMACRICYEPGNVVRVCACKGSVEWVHLACIQQWIDASHRHKCELCGQLYHHTALRQPIHVQHLFEWCFFGITLGTLQSAAIWLCHLLNKSQSITIIHIAVIFTAIFTFLAMMSILLLWAHHKRARPLIASYYGMLVFTNVTLQLCVPAPALVPFYVFDGCLLCLTAGIDHAVFVQCPVHCHRLN